MAVNFWKARRVLVTGHTGFKGTWLCLWLAHRGAHITGYSLPAPSKPSFFELVRKKLPGNYLRGDVRNLPEMRGVFKRFKPEIVFHLAAQSLVRESYQQPVQTYSTNVMGTVNVLECIRHSQSVHAALIITSDKCYAENRSRPFRENDALGGRDPYSSSKACAEIAAAAYQRSFSRDQQGIATVRAGNVIGGGDWARDRLIPDFMRALQKNQKLKLRYPGAIRPWQHVAEALNGYFLLAQALYHKPERFSEGWNFGPEKTDFCKVFSVADRLAHFFGKKKMWIAKPGLHPHESPVLKLNSTKAKKNLRWKPRWNLQQTLEKTAEWYQAYFEKEDMFKVTMQQIVDFERTSA